MLWSTAVQFILSHSATPTIPQAWHQPYLGDWGKQRCHVAAEQTSSGPPDGSYYPTQNTSI